MAIEPRNGLVATYSGVDMGGILYFPTAEEGAVEPNIKHVIVKLKETKLEYLRAGAPCGLQIKCMSVR